MKKIIPLLLVLILLSTCSSSQALFQIVKETGYLLINGRPYTSSAENFWKIKRDSACFMFCESETLLFVRNISLITNEPGVPHGTALVVRDKVNNCWKCVMFIPQEDTKAFGSVTKLSFPDSSRNFIIAQYPSTTVLYERWYR